MTERSSSESERDAIARLIAPSFASDAFDAQGHWLNNYVRCQALDAADRIISAPGSGRSSPDIETAVTLEELLNRSIHMEIVVDDGTRWHFSQEQLDLARAALTAAKSRFPDAAATPRDPQDEDWNIRKYIDFLRADEGDSVTLLCDNPEPRTSDENNAIECNGYWTNWQDRRFAGETLEAALALAYFECRQWRENPPAEVSPDPLPAYADPNFKYNEATGSYHRIRDDAQSEREPK